MATARCRVVAALVCALLLLAASSLEALSSRAERIVSMAPSITEILYALGLGDRIVGVTSLCLHPPEARGVAKVGGFYNPDLETILSLRPDLVVAVPSATNLPLLRKLEAFGIEVLSPNPMTLEEVLGSFSVIGRATGTEARAHELVREIRETIGRVSAMTAGLPRPRAAFVVVREPLYLVGPGSFLHELLELAGAQNVLGGEAASYARISLEEVIAWRPEVIIDASGLRPAGTDEDAEGEESESFSAAVGASWARWPSIPAVREGRIVAVREPFVTIPGPRLGKALEYLAAAVHPEVFASGDGGSLR